LIEIEETVQALIPITFLPGDYIKTLSTANCLKALQACLLVFILSSSEIALWQMQLQAALAEIDSFDTSIISRTGFGKTIVITIPHILDLAMGCVSVVISPFKHL
jgi:hypothetical protein